MRVIKVVFLAAILMASMIGSLPIVADTVADSVRDFSGKHGVNGWSYGYWDRSVDADGSYDQSTDFRFLSHFGSDPLNGLSSHSEFTTGKLWYLEDGRYYTSIWAEGGHPHGSMDLGIYARSDQWVVRRWVSTTNGGIDIRGHAGKVMPWGENWTGTVKVRIVRGGVRVYVSEVGEGGGPYAVSGTVQIGTPVDFLIGPGSAIGVAKFTGTIEASGESSR